MPLTLQDLYAEPRFIENVEQPIAAEIMTRKFPTLNSDAVDPMKAIPIAVSLDKVAFSNEEEERIQGEVIVSARVATRARITLASKVRTAGGIEDSTQDISQDFRGLNEFQSSLELAREVNRVRPRISANRLKRFADSLRQCKSNPIQLRPRRRNLHSCSHRFLFDQVAAAEGVSRNYASVELSCSHACVGYLYETYL